jgi:hypothetical protein
METALQDNMDKLMKFLLIFFVMPLLFTNIMYCGVFIFLRKSWNIVQPSSCSDVQMNSQQTCDNSKPGTSKSSNTNELPLLSTRGKFVVSNREDKMKKRTFPKNARIVIGAVNTVRAFQYSHRTSLFQTLNKGQTKPQKQPAITTPKSTTELQKSKLAENARTHLDKTNVPSLARGIAHISARRQRKAYIWALYCCS